MRPNLSALVLALAGLLATCATAAESQYLFLRGTKSGPIKGAVTVRGMEGAIAVESISHEIASPRDVASGQAAGRTQHKPLVVVVPLDLAWPRLMNALVSNEILSQVVLRTIGVSTQVKGSAAQQEVRVIELTNASIAGIEEYTATNAKGEKQEFLKISFSYQKIVWNHLEGRTQAMDDWSR